MIASLYEQPTGDGFSLRDYQRDIVSSVVAGLREHKSVLAVAPTGCGKTEIFCELVRLAMAQRKPGHVIVVCEGKELIEQTARRILKRVGWEPQVEMADRHASAHGCPIVVASVDSLRSGTDAAKRWQKFSPRLVIVDECDLAVAPKYVGCLEGWRQACPEMRLVGVTATPDRSDKKALGRVFEGAACNLTAADMIRMGWLVPVRQRFGRCLGLDVSQVRKVAGELHKGDVDESLRKEIVMKGMVDEAFRQCGDRRSIVFAHSVAHAEEISNRLNDDYRKGCAEWVCGETEAGKRKSIFDRFGAGEFQYLVNVGITTRGWDDPAKDGKGVQCVVMMRLTLSRARYAQCVGRVLRPLPGTVDGLASAEDRHAAIASSAKPSAMVLDFLGNTGRHQLVHASDILGGLMQDEHASKRVMRMAEDACGEDGVEFDVMAEVAKAIQEEEKLAKRTLQKGRKVASIYDWTDVDPFAENEIRPGRIPPWHRDRLATPGQVDFLVRNGIRREEAERLNFVHAGQLVENVMGRPSDKQLHKARRLGISLEGCDRRKASERIAKAMSEAQIQNQP